jgi:hypothetical protein
MLGVLLVVISAVHGTCLKYLMISTIHVPLKFSLNRWNIIACLGMFLVEWYNIRDKA